MYRNLNYIVLLCTGTIGLYAVAHLMDVISITMLNELRILEACRLGFLFCIMAYVCTLYGHVITHGIAVRSYLHLVPSTVAVTLYGFVYCSLDQLGYSRFIQEFASTPTPSLSQFHQVMADTRPFIATGIFVVLLIMSNMMIHNSYIRGPSTSTIEADANPIKT